MMPPDNVQKLDYSQPSVFMKLIRYCTFFFVLTLISACTNHRLAENAWPTEMPSRSYFLTVYNADEDNKRVQTEDEYLKWIVRFYNGWELYRRGWIKMTDELMAQVENPAQAKEIKFKIDRIGRLVAGEWAKKSETRTIYLRHVSIWGNSLLESLDRGEPLPLINRINQDVDDLLARKIHPDVITAHRYYAQDEDDPFI